MVRQNRALSLGRGVLGGVLEMYKNFLAGGVALCAAFALQPAAALADTQIGIAVGNGQYYRDYPVYDPGYPDYDDEYDDDDYISCSEGRRIVREYGFRQGQAHKMRRRGLQISSRQALPAVECAGQCPVGPHHQRSRDWKLRRILIR